MKTQRTCRPTRCARQCASSWARGTSKRWSSASRTKRTSRPTRCRARRSTRSSAAAATSRTTRTRSEAAKESSASSRRLRRQHSVAMAALRNEAVSQHSVTTSGGMRQSTSTL
eukprot:351290-Chlamydomonas_euryale.AAC.3